MSDVQVIANLIDECVAAANAKDRKRASETATRLHGEMKKRGLPPDEKDAIRLVKSLRSFRLFGDLAATADVMARLGVSAPIVRRYLAQGLVETGNLEAGIAVAQGLAANLEAEIKRMPAGRDQAQLDLLLDERADALALIGRAHKQTYVELSAAAPAHVREKELQLAIDYYMLAFNAARPHQRDFPATNVMALLGLAGRDGMKITGAPSIQALAVEVEKAAKLDLTRNYDDHWAASSIAEAHLARGNLKEAADWFGRYAYHPKVDAFALAGTIRQLEQIWGLKAGTEDAGQILAVLKSRLLHFEGGTVNFSLDERRALGSADASDFGELSKRVLDGQLHYLMPRDDAPAAGSPAEANLERSLTKTSALVDFRTMLMAVRRGQAVARICAGPGSTIGTGFLVRASDLCPALGDELLILTNAHVVSKHGSPIPGSAPIAPSLARIYFDIDAIEGKDCSYKCELLWESPINEMDTAVLRPVPGDIQHQPLRIAPRDVQLVPESGATGAEPPTQLLIMGHPDGGSLKISVEHQQRSSLLEIGTRPPGEYIYLHYRTPTEPGMSGSPVIHEPSGLLIGLHHAGPKDDVSEIPRLNGQPGGIRANEGVLIHSIAQAFSRHRTGGLDMPARSSLHAIPPAAAPPVKPAAPSGPASAAGVPRITYAELVAKLADPKLDKNALAPYFLQRPEASGPYQPAFTVNPALVDIGQDGAEAQISSVPGIMRMMNRYCSLRRRALARARLQQGGDGLRFVCEGDSWFEYPIVVDDVIDHLDKDYTIFCLAAASDTLENMISEENFRTEIAPAIEEVKPHGFLLSAGGNDVVGEVLKSCLLRYDGKLMPGQYLNGEFNKHLLLLQKRFALAYNRLLSLRPQMKIFVHGYDMANPWPKGPWLGQYFEQLGIVDKDLQRTIVGEILDRVAGVHKALERGHPGRVFFVDARRSVPDDKWYDELHPNSDGFAHIANKFREKFEQVFGKTS